MTSHLPPTFAPPPEPQPKPPVPAFWLFHLFLRPRRFFSYFPDMVSAFSISYASLIVGVADVMGRITAEVGKSDLGAGGRVPELILESWGAYWVACLGVGAVLVGGRLASKLSEQAERHDQRAAAHLGSSGGDVALALELGQAALQPP